MTRNRAVLNFDEQSMQKKIEGSKDIDCKFIISKIVFVCGSIFDFQSIYISSVLRIARDVVL